MEKSSPNWVVKGIEGVGDASKFTKMKPWGVMWVWIRKSECSDGENEGREVYSLAVWSWPFGR
jgi:hypothetical protein